jgi:Uma2 family endonuclease
MLDGRALRIPAWVTDLETFRRWVRSEDVPEKTQVCYLAGEVWVDMSGEQVFSHNLVKQAFNLVLGSLVMANRLGRYHPDGILLGNPAADLSSKPDGLFVSRESLSADRVRLVPGTLSGFVELQGTPDMVLEVVSDSSVEKDTVTLPGLYWRAGIPEYWLVDARGKRLRFDILRRAARKYAAVRKQGGWVKSAVFGRSFRLVRRVDERDDPEYVVETR